MLDLREFVLIVMKNEICGDLAGNKSWDLY